MGKATRKPSLKSLAEQHWSKNSLKKNVKTKEILPIIHQIYKDFLSESIEETLLVENLTILYETKYLENFLWPFIVLFHEENNHKVDKEMVFSMVTMILFRAKQSTSNKNLTWIFLQDTDTIAFHSFVSDFLTLLTSKAHPVSILEVSFGLEFLIVAYRTIELPIISQFFLKLTSLPVWYSLSESQRELEFKKYPKLARHWHKLFGSETAEDKEAKTPASKKRKVSATIHSTKKTSSKTTNTVAAVSDLEKCFFGDLIHKVLDLLRQEEKEKNTDLLTSLFVSLLIDLLSQLPTRRFMLVLVKRLHVHMYLKDLLVCQTKWMDLLDFYLAFPMDEQTGTKWTLRQLKERHAKKIQFLQTFVFENQEEFNTFSEKMSILPVSTFAKEKDLTTVLTNLIGQKDTLAYQQLVEMVVEMGILANQKEAQRMSFNQLVTCCVDEWSFKWTIGTNQHKVSSFFPTEMDIWQVTDNHNKTPQHPLVLHTKPLPKIGLQYLSEVDFLNRYIELTQAETLKSIRQDLEKTISSMEPVRTLTNETIFQQQKCPHGIPLVQQSFQIVHIGKPKIDSFSATTNNSQVEAVFEIELTEEELSFQPQETLFFVSIRATKDEIAQVVDFKEEDDKQQQEEYTTSYFPEENGILLVRSGQFVEMRDEKGHFVYQREEEDNQIDQGQVVSTRPFSGFVKPKGRKRQLKVLLDPIQYQKDLQAQRLDQYEQINLLVRRPMEKNQFKSVLDSLQASLHASLLFGKKHFLPEWLYDFYLGYGQPNENKLSLFYEDSNNKNVLVDMVKQHVVNDNSDRKLLIITKTTDKLKETFDCLMKDVSVVEEHGHELVHLSFSNTEYGVKGRIDLLLQKRLQVLQKASQLAKCVEQESSFGLTSTSSRTTVLSDSTSYSCENALMFYQMYLRPLVFNSSKDSSLLKNMMQEWKCEDIKTLWTQVDNLFQTIQQLQVFELLRSPRQRHQMYLSKHAKVIFMTSTHAACVYKNNLLNKIAFRTLVIQESEKFTEVDALIPFLLTSQHLDQVVLFGTDQSEESEPDVQDQMLKEKCHLDQSLFTRFQRLGVPVQE